MDSVDAVPAGRRPRVAVLGGTGFVGRPLCRALDRLGYEVVVVARRAPAHHDGHRVRVLDLAYADVADVADVFRAEDVRVVVNAAGGMWGLTDEQMVAANLTLVEKVIEAAGTLSRRPRLVQLGSVHEYGLVPIGTSMDEDTPPKPVNAYAELKLRCTEAVVDATGHGVVDGVSLRIGNVVGAGQPRVSLLGVVVEQLWQAHREGRPAVLETGPLGSLRDFVNLSDVVQAITTVVSVPELPARIFNIGTGQATSARDMVRLLIEISGVPTELIEAESAAAEPTWQQMRIDRARELLGWSPAGDLRDGVKELWEHQAENARG
ncbi:NAD-dependent epimerase/dehydratase family protein [Planosporangium sp. 12N6]|uniref:NAD-dependent epimerase/dehydratase family protein n=1 Tax=Planosporangium spinosum TaxID=3402278 RepID=UPI003CEC2BE8